MNNSRTNEIMKKIAIILFSFCLLGTSLNAQQLLSWQQKVELVGVPDNLSRTMLKDLFFANGFRKESNEYTTAVVMNLENSLTKENGKWYAVGNKHLWFHYTKFGRGNITVDIENSKLIFKNPLPDAKLNKALAKDRINQAKATATEEAIASIKYTDAEQAVVSNLRYFQELVVLEGITGDFNQQKLTDLFTKNNLPRTRYGGFEGVDAIIHSLQSIEDKWYVIVRNNQPALFDKYSDFIKIKNGKMTFAKLP